MSNEVLLKVCKIVSDEVGVTPRVLKSVCRKQDLVFGRMIMSKICRRDHRVKTKDLAEYFGVTTGSIYHYVRGVDNELKTNAKFRETYNSVMKRMK